MVSYFKPTRRECLGFRDGVVCSLCGTGSVGDGGRCLGSPGVPRVISFQLSTQQPRFMYAHISKLI